MNRFKPAIFYTIFFLFVITFCSLAESYDYDFWARLIAGMGFVQTGHVLKHDFLSYTPTHMWFDHEWGSGVIFYLTQHFLSSSGILILQSVLILLLFVVMIKVIKLRGLKTTTAYNFIFFFFSFHAMVINLKEPIRCQMFTYLFFAVFLYILESARKGNNKPLWTMPFLMIIWNNLHGGCVSGIGLIVIYIIGEILNKAPFKKYIFALIPTTLVLLINPWGLSYISFLLKATTMPRPYIMEWWGLFSKFYMNGFMSFKWFALVLIIVECIIVLKSIYAKTFSFKLINKTKVLALVITLYLAVQHVKMVPFFAILVTCFVYDDFYILVENIFDKIRKWLKMETLFGQGFKNKKEFAIYSLIMVFVITNLSLKSFRPNIRGEKYPLREVEFLKINNIKGKLFVNFGLGSYASYKLYPNNKIYMDGRYEEVYDDNLLPEMRRFALHSKGWEELLSKYPPDIILIEKFYQAFDYLKTSKDWKLIYNGKYFGVFVKKDMAKKSLKDYKQPSDKTEYYRQHLFDTDISFKKSS